MSTDHFGLHGPEENGRAKMREFGHVLEIYLPFVIISSIGVMLPDLLNIITDFEERQMAEDGPQPTE